MVDIQSTLTTPSDLAQQSNLESAALLTPYSSPSNSYNASQADVACFKAISAAPDAAKYPNAARWYKHIATYESEFATLSGDASKPYTVYGPEESELTVNPAKAPEKAAEDDEDVDLFGSDDEEEDTEAARIREERLEEYRKKKEGKVKPAAKSIVTLDVKPWGTFIAAYQYRTWIFSEATNIWILYANTASCR